MRIENQNKLVISKQEWIALGKQAGWLGDRWQDAKTIGKAIFNPNDYMKGLRQIDQMRSLPKTKRNDMFRAFEALPQIGQGLSQYRINLDQSIRIFKQLAEQANVADLTRNDISKEDVIPALNALIAKLPPIGNQILRKAMANIPNADIDDQSIGLQSLNAIALESLKIATSMRSSMKTDTLTFEQPNVYEDAINYVLSLPEPTQLAIVQAILRKNPAIREQLSPVQPQTRETTPAEHVASCSCLPCKTNAIRQKLANG